MQKLIRHRAFLINNNIATWDGDGEVKFPLALSPSEHCLYEGMWIPDYERKITNYSKALAGVCIWNKYDCVFMLEPKGKGNSGAIRSFSSPRDREDLIKRLEQGQKIHKIIISANPFGPYQTKTISWQADVVERFGIQHVYYALPLLEYRRALDILNLFLSKSIMNEMMMHLESHHDSLKNYAIQKINANVEFIQPLLQDESLTIEQSYTWPYENLDIDLGIEEVEEIRIPYHVKKSGRDIPPILLGMLSDPCPYYQNREYTDTNKPLEIFI